MRTSGVMAAFLDRLRVFIFGSIAGDQLKNKIGIRAGVSWNRYIEIAWYRTFNL